MNQLTTQRVVTRIVRHVPQEALIRATKTGRLGFMLETADWMLLPDGRFRLTCVFARKPRFREVVEHGPASMPSEVHYVQVYPKTRIVDALRIAWCLFVRGEQA